MTGTKSLDTAVVRVARRHFQLEPTLERIVWLRNGAGNEVRLIEVNRATLPTGSVDVFYFAPSPELPVPLRMAEITPAEWKGVLSGRIPLPANWTLDDHRSFEPKRNGR